MKPFQSQKRICQENQTELQVEFAKDIWDGRKLGADIKPSDCNTINFTNIYPLWLRQAAKQFIKYSFSTVTWATCLNRGTSLKQFSQFLSETYPWCLPQDINRSLIVDFLAYLASKYSENTRISTIAYLQNFFYLCSQNGWAEVTDKVLFFKGDAPKLTKPAPRYIPEEVLKKLNQHIDFLPEPIMRMVLIIQECGMRISELCRLKFDCLRQDTEGSWWLTYYQFKFKKDHTICISTEVAAVIQEQQKYIKENLETGFEYLFCANQARVFYSNRYTKEECSPPWFPVAKPICVQSFSRYLNNLATAKNICTVSGKLWRFQSHQFRHSIATKMINNNVPIHIIKRYLGHESFEMTIRYAHIHDKTLKNELTKYYDLKVVNIAGEVVESNNPELDNDVELQYMKRKIFAQALPNGTCARPVIQGSCPHANACLTCGDFRTTKEFLDLHKSELERTEQLIEKAKANDWQRQVEMNEQVKKNLQNIIKRLETDNEQGEAD